MSPRARCRLAAERMPFADDVTAVDPGVTWRSSIQDGGVTSQPSHVISTAKLWSLPDARRARVVNALKGTIWIKFGRPMQNDMFVTIKIETGSRFQVWYYRLLHRRVGCVTSDFNNGVTCVHKGIGERIGDVSTTTKVGQIWP